MVRVSKIKTYSLYSFRFYSGIRAKCSFEQLSTRSFEVFLSLAKRFGITDYLSKQPSSLCDFWIISSCAYDSTETHRTIASFRIFLPAIFTSNHIYLLSLKRLCNLLKIITYKFLCQISLLLRLCTQ